MKTKLCFGLVLMLSGCLHAFGQSTGGVYRVTSSVIAGGGGTSTGGVFRVCGTIGQPVTGDTSGGNYSLQSGFWGIVQTPGAPHLRIRRSGVNGAIVSWPTPSTGWVLQQTSVLASPPQVTVWTDVTSPPVVVVGDENTVTISEVTDNRYFRLRHQ